MLPYHAKAKVVKELIATKTPLKYKLYFIKFLIHS